MATLRRGLVDKMKKAATKAGTRGARALVETTVAAVKTVDKLQETLGRRSSKARSFKVPITSHEAEPSRAASKNVATKRAAATKSRESVPTKTRRTATEPQPVALREAGRKTMPGAAAKRSKAAKAPSFKVKRGQKHRHTGR